MGRLLGGAQKKQVCGKEDQLSFWRLVLPLAAERTYPVGTEKADVLKVARGGACIPDLHSLSG